MISREEFADVLDIQEPQAAQAYDVFREELTAHRKTLAHRTVDLAAGLRLIGLDDGRVVTAVRMLAGERR